VFTVELPQDPTVEFPFEVVAAGTLRDVAPQFGGFFGGDDERTGFACR
jgi:hypothetical protein